MAKFYTKWDHPISFALDCDEGDVVERAGYIPVKEQAERLRAAGENLLQQRAEQYDGEDAEQIDPSRNMDQFERHDYFCAVDQMLTEKAKKARQQYRDRKTQGKPPAEPLETPPEPKKEVFKDE